MFEGLQRCGLRRESRRDGNGTGSAVISRRRSYNESLLVQYLVSRSHEHGGRTLEGRLTLPELLRRMRKGGYLSAHGIEADRSV